AREYDPTLGRFISVDPLLDEGDPRQLNAYQYGYNNPLAYSDPDGLRPLGAGDSGCTNCRPVYTAPKAKKNKQKSYWKYG
ncbi:RHS repeat-associated core domain-containing protein, partial [Knoellia sinensis]|uniref:RHS repeat-associated core domain-containing protein n=1 Tax=Knoellia sinensis TaxID=136100 RepID=UPI00056CD535